MESPKLDPAAAERRPLIRNVVPIAVAAALAFQITALAGPGEVALKSEADYIVNCSFTREAHNNTRVERDDAGYGALNNVRLVEGPDWVRPGEGAMAIIGLMAATSQLRAAKIPVAKYEAVMDAFFQTWVLKHRAAICEDSASRNFGGFAQQMSYQADGSLQPATLDFNSGATGAMLCALWKYHEFNQANGRREIDRQWLKGDAFAIAVRAGKFLKRCHNARYNLLSPSPAGGNLWINDASLAVAGLRCLAQWEEELGKSIPLDDSGTMPAQFAGALTRGLEGMKDKGPAPGFFKFLNPADGSRGYDGSIDQLCFVPYETNALDPAQPFAKAISEFWTRGSGGRRMTYQTTDAGQWTYYGTRWHLYDAAEATADRLTPGAGLQLAKVEWKYANQHRDKVLRERAWNRYGFVSSSRYSDLWLGGNGRIEAGVGGGIVDWRQATAGTGKNSGAAEHAPDWQRFIDTSAYFIEVTLMKYWGQDTKYTPN